MSLAGWDPPKCIIRTSVTNLDALMAPEPTTGNQSDMELDSVSNITSNTGTPSRMGRAPQLPPPAASMKQFSRDIRVVNAVPDSSVFVENPSPPGFKRQRTEVPMELTGIQNYVAVSTPFKNPEYDFEVPQLASAALDNGAFDATGFERAFGDGGDDTFDATNDPHVYVDAENEPPAAQEESPLRRPLLPKQLSPVQEASQETSEILPAVTAPVPVKVQQSSNRDPGSPVSNTAPIIPSTPRRGLGRAGRTPARTPHHTPHRTPGRTASRTPRTPSLRRALEQTPQPVLQPHGTPTRVSPLRTPQRTPRVISIPSSPDRASPMLRGSLRSEDESFMNMDPGRLESVDDLMVQLAIKDFNPTSINEILPLQEIRLTDLAPEDEVTALTLQTEINRLIDQGYDLETKIKKVAEKMDVNAVMSKYHTSDRKERLALKHRIRSLYDHLQAKSELRSVEGQLNTSREILDQLKGLKSECQARYTEYEALRQQSKIVEEEIENLRNLHNDEDALSAQIEKLNGQVNSRFDLIQARNDEISNRSIKNEKLERARPKAEFCDVTTESKDDEWYRRQYFAKFETLKTLHGVQDVRFLAGDGFCLVLDGLELLYTNHKQSFRLLGSNLLSKHYFKMLSNYKTVKANIQVWKGYLTAHQQLQQLRRLGYNEWLDEGKVLVFKLMLKQGSVQIYFRDEDISLECNIADQALTEQVLRVSGLAAVTILASKL